MKLRELTDSDIKLVSEWMSDKSNYQWFDFGSGRQILCAATLKIMSQRPIHCLRLFAPSSSGSPVGLVALSNIAVAFNSATLWYVLGDKSQSGRGYASNAVGKMLTLAFTELGLESVNAWAVEKNNPSIRVLYNNRFRLIGRQRRCHAIDAELLDRLWFDILAKEHSI